MTITTLNQAQQEAVTATEGFIRVIAGAGSGKTRALSHRFAFLVNEIGVLPANIACVTFTNKAANEMRQRIRQLTGDRDTGKIGTFHSLCVTILQEDAHAVQYPSSFLVLDNGDIDQMLAIIYEERGLTLRQKTYADARDMFEMRKCKYEPEYYRDMIAMPLDVLRQKYLEATEVNDILFYGYLYQQKKCFGLDYNDLIKFTLYIFAENPDIREKWQRRFEYLMVDEFQDIDDLQYELMEVLSGYHHNLFVVGDPDQTIYTWRGANVHFLMNFDQKFIGTQTIMMTDNYRSTPEILATANALIAKNGSRIPKDLSAVREHGATPIYFHGKHAVEEARWICEQIKSLKESGVKPADIAILYRAHYVTRTLEEVFQKEELPYVIYSGVPFYERAEIKEALSYLRMIAYRDDLSFARIINNPKRNIGEKRLHVLRDYAETHQTSLYDALKQNLEEDLFRSTRGQEFVDLIEKYSHCYESMPVSELLSAVLEESGYEEARRTEGSGERLDNLAELKQSIYEYETTCGEEVGLIDYLSHLAFFGREDNAVNKDSVRLMTIHKAKGLEFPYVFLCSMEENILPSKKTATKEDMEEERRLAFVAITRAQDGLFITDSEGQTHDGSFRYPSRFIFDADYDWQKKQSSGRMEWINPPGEDLIGRAYQDYGFKDRDLAATSGEWFAPGTRVRHNILGLGTIVSVEEKKMAYVIHFDDLNTERTIRFRVKLEAVE